MSLCRGVFARRKKRVRNGEEAQRNEFGQEIFERIQKVAFQSRFSKNRYFRMVSDVIALRLTG